MMNTKLKYAALGFGVALALLGVIALAKTVPNTFKSGEIISAAQMNANFDALDNAKQARVTGTCTVGQTITAVNADGTFQCATIQDPRFGSNPNTVDNGKDPGTCVIGEIRLTAGDVGVGTKAEGQLLPITQNPALFTRLGTRFGGDGTTTFALPDLRSSAPKGLTYTICVEGIFPMPK